MNSYSWNLELILEFPCFRLAWVLFMCDCLKCDPEQTLKIGNRPDYKDKPIERNRRKKRGVVGAAQFVEIRKALKWFRPVEPCRLLTHCKF